MLYTSTSFPQWKVLVIDRNNSASIQLKYKHLCTQLSWILIILIYLTLRFRFCLPGTCVPWVSCWSQCWWVLLAILQSTPSSRSKIHGGPVRSCAVKCPIFNQKISKHKTWKVFTCFYIILFVLIIITISVGRNWDIVFCSAHATITPRKAGLSLAFAPWHHHHWREAPSIATFAVATPTHCKNHTKEKRAS